MNFNSIELMNKNLFLDNQSNSFLIFDMTTVEIINASIIDNLAKKYVLYTFNILKEDGTLEFTVSKRFSGFFFFF